MEVRDGYKQTEVGVIPGDWMVKKLMDIADVKTGPFGSSLHERDYVQDGTPIITVEHLGEHGVLHENFPMVSDFDRARLKAYSLQENDIVFSRVGSVDRNSLIKKDENGWLFSGRLLRIRINSENLNSTYLSYHFHQEPTKQRIRSVAVGQTMASLNTEILKNISVALPPTKAEQTAIAIALSDADALIQSLEKLIAKKRNIKQGAIQELLKPQEGWVVKKLGEIGDVTGAGVDKKVNDGEIPVRLVNYLDVFHRDFIYSHELNHWVTTPVSKAQKCAVQKGDIFFTPSSEMRFDIAISAVTMEDMPDAAYSYHIVRLRLFDDWDLAFRAYIFKTKPFLDQAETICEGSGKRYVISLANFREMNICFPSEKAEQTRIAAILSDMDAEIAALETKLAKYRQIKQGMMQELLTGRIRLV